MNAQQIINECNSQKLNPRQFRQEMNISFLINETVNQWEKLNEWRKGNE